MKKNFICVLFTFTFKTAKWIILYIMELDYVEASKYGVPSLLLSKIQL